MTYVIAKTYRSGRAWAKKMLSADEQRTILHNPEAIRQKALIHSDCVYLVTNHKEHVEAVMDAMCGCRVFGQTEWFERDSKFS